MRTRFSRLLTLILGLGLLFCAASSSASGPDISDQLREQVLRKIDLVEKDGPNMAEMMTALREAGASYLPELVAPIDVAGYQDMERRRMILGVYLMDMTYAGTFHQSEPTALYGQAVFELMNELGFPQPERERQYREALDRLDEPDGEQRMRALFVEQMNDTTWQSMLDNVEGLDLVVDGLYAFLIEGMYLAGELAALSGYDSRFMSQANELRGSFRAFNDVLQLFEDNSPLAERVEKDERVQFIADLFQLFGETPMITPELLDSLRPVIAMERGAILR